MSDIIVNCIGVWTLFQSHSDNVTEKRFDFNRKIKKILCESQRSDNEVGCITEWAKAACGICIVDNQQ